MSEIAKNKLEDIFQWITRALLGIIFYMSMNVMNRFELLSYDVQTIRTTNVLLSAQVTELKEQNRMLQSDIDNIFRNYELKLKK